MTSVFAIFLYLENCKCYTKRCRIYDFLSVFNTLCSRISFRKRLNPKNVVFALQANIYQQYHIILHYASNFDIFVTNTNNPSNSVEKRFRTLQAACTCILACVWCVGEGGIGIKIASVFFFSCNFSCTDNFLIRNTFYTGSKLLKRVFSKYHAIVG